MYQHHKESLENLVRYFQGQEEVIALIFGGSVAKGNERLDQESCKAFVDTYLAWTSLPVSKDVDRILTRYVKGYEEWWIEEHSPFINEW